MPTSTYLKARVNDAEACFPHSVNGELVQCELVSETENEQG